MVVVVVVVMAMVMATPQHQRLVVVVVVMVLPAHRGQHLTRIWQVHAKHAILDRSNLLPVTLNV